jgi:hypothetical protein
MTKLTRQGEPFANFDPAYTTQKMVLSGYKSGGSIKIKEENKGKFTDYCGGKVTEECIRKGKNSSNPTTRKIANFA